MKTLTLVVDSRCQLDCSFCLCSESLNKGEGSSIQDMKDFLSWQFELYPEESFVIELFGAEPTLAYDKIKELYLWVNNIYPDVKVSWMLFTNGILTKDINKDFEFFMSIFDEIIVSIEGPRDLSIDRHPSDITYNKVIDNIKRMIPYNNTGVGFVLFPDSDIDRIYSFFNELGVRYYNFEIVTHINNDKSSGVTNKDLYRFFKYIFNNVIKYSLEHPEDYRLFTIPRELISSENYFKIHNREKSSCLNSVRALAPSGNIYPCRDLAVNEYKLNLQSDPNSIFRSSVVRPFNIKNFQLDRESDSFKEELKDYEKYISCPLKSMEFYHFIGSSKMPWLEDKDFQNIFISTMFRFSWDFFQAHHNNTWQDPDFLSSLRGKVNIFSKVFESLGRRYE